MDTDPTQALALPDDLTPAQARERADTVIAWAESCDDIDALATTLDEIDVVAKWVAKQNREAGAEVQRAARLVEVRIGSLIPPEQGKRNLARARAKLTARHVTDFRKLFEASTRDDVRAAIDAGKSRRGVLAVISPPPKPERTPTPKATTTGADGSVEDLAAAVSRVLARHQHIAPSDEERAQYKAITRRLVDWVNGPKALAAPKSTPKPAPKKACKHEYPPDNGRDYFLACFKCGHQINGKATK